MIQKTFLHLSLLFLFNSQWFQTHLFAGCDMETYDVDPPIRLVHGVPVPDNFPDYEVTILDQTAPGFIFTTSGVSADAAYYLMILKNDGTPVYYEKADPWACGFTTQPTGVLSRKQGNYQGAQYLIRDNHYSLIDTLVCGNGFLTDEHELLILPDGHSFMIALDYQERELGRTISGGRTSATLIGNHIIELDANKNLVFKWECWDHFLPDDAIAVDWSQVKIDYIHMNSIALDFDDNLIISSRHLCEVTKIDRNTGDIIWRLGGKNNQFKWINETEEFSYQHDARPVPGKPNHYTIFDNGNLRRPRYTRIVEYQIDPDSMTATKVWEYRRSPDFYTNAGGSARRLSNGNTLISWASNALPVCTEINQDKEIVYELSGKGRWSAYRSFRNNWEGKALTPRLIVEADNEIVKLIFNQFEASGIHHYNIYADTCANPEQLIGTRPVPWTVLSDFPEAAQWFFRVTSVDSAGQESGFSNEENAFVKILTPGDNKVLNGDFGYATAYWDLKMNENASAGASVDSLDQCHVAIENGGSNYHDIQLIQKNIYLISNAQYTLEFDAYSGTESTTRKILVQIGADKYWSTAVTLIPKRTHYSLEFTAPVSNNNPGILLFAMGGSSEDIYLDHISLVQNLTGVSQEDKISESGFFLFPSYPNPFNPATHIRFDLPQTSRIEIYVYDIQGKLVDQLLDERYPAGQHEVQWNAANHPSGIYFIRMTSDKFTETRKCLLLK